MAELKEPIKSKGNIKVSVNVVNAGRTETGDAVVKYWLFVGKSKTDRPAEPLSINTGPIQPDTGQFYDLNSKIALSDEEVSGLASNAIHLFLCCNLTCRECAGATEFWFVSSPSGEGGIKLLQNDSADVH